MIYRCIEDKTQFLTKGKEYDIYLDGLYYFVKLDGSEASWPITKEQLDLYFEPVPAIPETIREAVESNRKRITDLEESISQLTDMVNKLKPKKTMPYIISFDLSKPKSDITVTEVKPPAPKVGDIVTKKYRIERALKGCYGCFFYGLDDCGETVRALGLECKKTEREDGEEVIFKEVK